MRAAKYSRGQWAVTRERFALEDVRPPPPAREAVDIRDVVSGLMQRFEGARSNCLDRLTGAWTSLVGADIAAHSRPGRLDRDLLIVFVDSSVWLYELKRLGVTRMLQNVQRFLGSGDVKRISLQLDPEPRGRLGK